MDFIVHGILQARILEWVAIPFFRGSSQPRDRTQVSYIERDSLPSEPPEIDPNQRYSRISPLLKYLTCIRERVTGRKARDLPVEEIGCKCQTFFTSLLSSKREQTSVTFFPLLYTNFKRGFS